MSQAKDVLQTYQKYYVDRDYEQVDLFQLLKSEFAISHIIYPGSFIHISPSDLEAYFLAKASTPLSKDYLHTLGRGVGYTKTAPLDFFRRVSG
ncbi:MAG: hypothetical protein KC422_17045 [Trueperaceae bacterium]|nr:hypothetical protein [Trueperaceae bacterium]